MQTGHYKCEFYVTTTLQNQSGTGFVLAVNNTLQQIGSGYSLVPGSSQSSGFIYFLPAGSNVSLLNIFQNTVNLAALATPNPQNPGTSFARPNTIFNVFRVF
ncbi:hypothetical protein [Bacillus sp. BB56-3]|uniref:hypothetical protein n=1 Tax=Bacillus sp. BB56-3 TaxID=2217831 RepID=UPI0013212411|nr:hypothetical protein [Bacillus sp. BB56-3]KAA0784007.1 hypothetical protein DN406_27595 [Bacillus sp. BB56-3]